jgi:hypothetical protein
VATIAGAATRMQLSAKDFPADNMRNSSPPSFDSKAQREAKKAKKGKSGQKVANFVHFFLFCLFLPFLFPFFSRPSGLDCRAAQPYNRGFRITTQTQQRESKKH